SRGRIIARGRDRARLLHNLASNDIKNMTPGTGCYAFLLSPQGRIQADLCIYCFDDHFLLDTEPELREKVYQHIKRYIIADQVDPEDVSAQTACIGLEGPSAAPMIEGFTVDYGHMPWKGGTAARVTVTGQPGYRIFGPAASGAETIAAL